MTIFNIKDIEKYYRQTFIVCPEFDPNRMLYVSNVTHNGLEVSFEDQDGSISNGFIEVTEDHDYEIVNPLPNRRMWLQLDSDYAGYVARVPARMWKKGMHRENTALYRIGQKGEFINIHIIHENLSRMMNPIHVEEINFHEEYPRSLALNSKWGWIRKTNDVFLHDKVVGRTSQKGKKLIILKEFKDLELPTSLSGMAISYV